MSLDRIGRWSIQKLDMLTEYASAYSVVMNAQKRTTGSRPAWLKSYYFVDAFAGAGVAINKADAEVSSYLEGSPLRVLSITPEFDHLWFIDKKAARAERLRITLSDHKVDAQRYTLVSGQDANHFINSFVQGLSGQERALVFLDPYGLQVDWATIESLAATRKVDVLITFSLMGVLRNLRRRGGLAPGFHRLLSRVTKSTSWIEGLYTLQGNLFGDPISVRGELAAAAVAERYQADLQGIFASVSDPAIMTNSRNSPIYALVFASQNEGAAPRIMRDVIGKSR